MKNQLIEQIQDALRSTILCLSAHPDNQPDSEFADRIQDLEDLSEKIKGEQQKEKTIFQKFQELNEIDTETQGTPSATQHLVLSNTLVSANK